MNLQGTVNSVLTVCLSPGDHRSDSLSLSAKFTLQELRSEWAQDIGPFFEVPTEIERADIVQEPQRLVQPRRTPLGTWCLPNAIPLIQRYDPECVLCLVP